MKDKIFRQEDRIKLYQSEIERLNVMSMNLERDKKSIVEDRDKLKKNVAKL